MGRRGRHAPRTPPRRAARRIGTCGSSRAERWSFTPPTRGDFCDAEIARVKDEQSHLFLDRAAAGVLDDFTEGMRRVLPDPTATRARIATRCGRRFRVVDGPPFAREEAWIAAYVAGLRGRVLDVGCGEQLYRDELAPLVRSGAVHYTGLDPDEASLARLRAALPEGRFHRRRHRGLPRRSRRATTTSSACAR